MQGKSEGKMSYLTTGEILVSAGFSNTGRAGAEDEVGKQGSGLTLAVAGASGMEGGGFVFAKESSLTRLEIMELSPAGNSAALGEAMELADTLCEVVDAVDDIVEGSDFCQDATRFKIFATSPAKSTESILIT